MKTSGFMQPTSLDLFDEQVDSLTDELSLAIKWDLPSTLLVVCNSEHVRTEAASALKDSLAALRQKVVRIDLGEMNGAGSLISLIRKFQDSEGRIFFIHANTQEHRDLLVKLGTHKDILSRKKIRLLIWLTVNGLSEFVRAAPEFWEHRQRIIEFPGAPDTEFVLQDAIESVWQGVGEYADVHEAAEEIISLEHASLFETVHLEKAEAASASANAQLLLTLGILNWRNGKHEKAEELLQEAIRSAIRLEDSLLEAECFNAIALVKFAQGKNDEAIDAYKQAIEIAPEQIFVWNNLGNLCLKIMRNDEAMLAFQKALKHNPKDSVAWNGLGTVYNRIGYIEDSIAAYRTAIEHSPALAAAWAGLGDSYRIAGRDQDAIIAFQKAIDLNKNLIAPWSSLAEIYSRQGRNRDAVKTFQRALVANSKNSLLWNELGLSLLKLAALEDAESAFLRSIDLDRSFGWAFCNLALAYSQQSKQLDAIEAAQKSLQLFSNNADKAEAWDRLAGFYRAINDYDNAMLAYQNSDLLKTHPTDSGNDETPHFSPQPASDTRTESTPQDISAEPVAEVKETRVAQAESPTKHPAPAWIFQPETWAENENASTTYSENVFWKEEMVDMSFEKKAVSNNPKEEPMNTQETVNPNPMRQAVSSLDFSEESLPTDPFENADKIAESKDPEVWNRKGNIHFQKGEYENAISAYNKAIELNPRFGWPYGNLAHTYLSLGKYAEAILLYQKSASLLGTKEEKAAAWNSLGNIYRHLNEYENALSAYQKADEIDPQNAGKRDSLEHESLEPNSHSAQVWLELGNLFFKSGAYKEAANSYSNAVKIDASSGWAHSNLAMSLVFQGKHREAISIYLKSIELFTCDKDKAVAWNRLGNVYRKMNDEENARKAYQAAVVLSNEKVSLLTRTRFSLLGNCYAN